MMMLAGLALVVMTGTGLVLATRKVRR